MSAVMIPVFLLLTALVMDVGNWYTHKRQLQGRADAGALAAGVEYAKNWKACVQTADPLLRASTAVEIADAAREYAGDPEASDYAGAILPATLRNTEIANQANLDVVINSSDPNYTDDTDYTDGGGSSALGNPCALHRTGDDIAPGHWTDVRVKERDLPSLVGTIGLPLARNGARARVEVRPAISGTRFLPLAVPNNVITKVQVRYYDHCTSPATLLATRNLAPLPVANQGGFAALGGGTLWGLPSGSDPNVGDPNQSFSLTLPSYGGCGQAYLPVGVEVRIASRNEIDLDANSCASCSRCVRGLLLAAFADPRVERRERGQPGPLRRRPPDGRLRQRRGVLRDAPGLRDELSLRRERLRQLGRPRRCVPRNLNVPANFTVTVNGVAATLRGRWAASRATASTRCRPTR